MTGTAPVAGPRKAPAAVWLRECGAGSGSGACCSSRGGAGMARREGRESEAWAGSKEAVCWVEGVCEGVGGGSGGLRSGGVCGSEVVCAGMCVIVRECATCA